MILNLTQHPATPEQVAGGVANLPEHERAMLVAALTFDALPTRQEITDRAEYIAALAVNNGFGGEDGDDPHFLRAMVGGAPYLMAPLERALLQAGVEPVYAFSVRESAESVQPDGSIRKTNVFRHTGFVEAA